MRGTGPGARSLAFFGDLCMRPWSANPRWVTAFDDFPLDSVEVKGELFRRAVEDDWIVVLTHEARIAGRQAGPGPGPLPVRGAVARRDVGRSRGTRAVLEAMRSPRCVHRGVAGAIPGSRRRHRRLLACGRRASRRHLVPPSSARSRPGALAGPRVSRAGPFGSQPSTRHARLARHGPFTTCGSGRRPDEELRRQGVDPVQVEDVRRGVEGDRVLEPVPVRVLAHVVDRRLLDGDPHDGEPLVAVPLVHLAQDRGLRLARRTPGRPEVEPDQLAAQVLEPDRVAVEVEELPGRAVGVGPLELGREVAGLEAGLRLADEERGGAGRAVGRPPVPPAGAMGRVTRNRTSAATATTPRTSRSWRRLKGPMPPRLAGGAGGSGGSGDRSRWCGSVIPPGRTGSSAAGAPASRTSSPGRSPPRGARRPATRSGRAGRGSARRCGSGRRTRR